MKDIDGSIKGIYVHCNGNLLSLGVTLLKNFNSFKIISDIIDMGDRYNISECKNLIETSFFHRDYNEDWSIIHTTKTKDFHTFLDTKGQDYNYLYENNSWYVVEDFNIDDKIDLKKSIRNKIKGIK
jgi:hypothetical protein